jgi:hypothetical protein
MNVTPQFKIIEVPSGIAIHSPFHPKNNGDFRDLHGHFERESRRWLLPPNALSESKIAELFGKESPNVVAQVTPNDLTVVENHLVIGGYAIAHFDARSNCVRMPDGVEIASGEWDVAASIENKYPWMVGSSITLKVVVRKDFAETHGLKIEEELGYQVFKNPLQPFADSDLKEEIEKRGYRVEKPKPALF